MKCTLRHNSNSQAYIIIDDTGDTIAMFYYGAVAQSIIEDQANKLIDVLSLIKKGDYIFIQPYIKDENKIKN